MNLRPQILHFVQVARWQALCAGAVGASLILSAAAFADDGIVVHGTGSASTRPTQIEMSATLTGEAELAADARVKFRDAKKRAQAAIASLKEPELSMLPGGLSVGTGVGANAQMMMMRGMAVPNVPQSVRLTEVSRIVLANTDKLEPEEMLDKLLKIIDVAKDSGLQIGPAPARNYYEMQVRAQEGGEGIATVSFKLPDSTALREKAFKVAIEDAKSKAQSLADLSGAKLGRIVSVHEDGADSANAQAMAIYNYAARVNKESGNDTSISGSNTGDVTLNVGLTVRFEIAK